MGQNKSEDKQILEKGQRVASLVIGVIWGPENLNLFKSLHQQLNLPFHTWIQFHV